MIPYDCRPEKRPRPGSQVIIGATESVEGASGHGSYAACWWLRQSPSNHPSHGLRILESWRRETKLRDRLITLDAVRTSCVWCGGVAYSVDPARRRRKIQA